MKPQKIAKIPYKFDSKYIFSDSMIRIGKLVEDKKSIEDIVNSTQLPYVFSKDSSPMKFNYDFQAASAGNNYSEINWILLNKEIKSPINLSFKLSENTLEGTILLTVELSVIKRELVPEEYIQKIIEIFPNISAEIIKIIYNKLKSDTQNIYNYESKIFNFSREQIIDFIFNFDQFYIKNGLFSSVSFEGNKRIEGCIINMEIDSPPKKIRIKIEKIKTNEQDLKWIIKYVVLDNQFKDISIEWKLIKITETQTLVYIVSKYSEPIEPYLSRNISEKKKNIFQALEEELEMKYN